MANEHFQCDVNKAFLKRFEGNEKSLYLDITTPVFQVKVSFIWRAKEIHIPAISTTTSNPSRK